MSEPLTRQRATARPVAGLLGGLVRTTRPRQWVKNLLVVAAPAAAGILFEPEVVARTALAFLAFCLAAGGTYCVNDALDADADRQHPLKRHRPVAAGLVPPRIALAAGTVLLAAGILVGLTATPALAVVVAAYVVLTVAYSVWLKHVSVIDLLAVASGFVVRAVAGGVAAEVPLSEWFLIVASFGALFVVTGKRHGELAAMGTAGPGHRPTLARYTPDFTAHVLTASLSVTLVAYCLWAFSPAGGAAGAGGGGGAWVTASILPCVAVLLRYAQLAHDGRGGDPVELLFADRGLQIGGLAWAVTLFAGLYLA